MRKNEAIAVEMPIHKEGHEPWKILQGVQYQALSFASRVLSLIKSRVPKLHNILQYWKAKRNSGLAKKRNRVERPNV